MNVYTDLIQEPSYWALNLRVRFDPPESETHAFREKDNIIEILRRAGYDVEPMGMILSRNETERSKQ